MKKELIVSSLLLMSPMHAVSAQEIQQMRSEISAESEKIKGLAFVGDRIETLSYFETNQEGRLERVVRHYLIRLEFKSSDQEYEFRGEGRPMELSMTLKYVDAETGEVFDESFGYYYAHSLGGRKYKMYDCDETKTCWDDSNNVEFYLFDNQQRLGTSVIVLKNNSRLGMGELRDSQRFYQVVED